MKKIVVLLGMLLGVSVAAYNNIAAGTEILSTGKSVTVSYAVAGVTRNANSATDAAATVAMNGGIKLAGATWLTEPNTNNLLAGEGASYTVTIINSGNFTEAVAAGIVSPTGGFAGSWTSALSSSNMVISREGVTVLTLAVTADPLAQDGDEGSLVVSLNGTTPGAFYKQYAGANAFNYGANGSVNTLLSFKVSAPNISITKSVTVQAPADYIAQGGGANDPVPGATLVYSLAYRNNGTAAGTGVEIVDTVPANTDFSQAAAPVGVTIQYSNDNGTTWGYTPAGVVDDTVTHVKWVVGALPGATGDAVTLSVVIE